MLRRRSELELFCALARDDADALAELNERLRRCVHWVLKNRMPDVERRLLGEVDEIVDDARERLERLRVRGFAGGEAQFRSYLYRVVVAATVDALHRGRLLDSLDAPICVPDGGERPLRDVIGGMVDPDLSASDALEGTERRERGRVALESLDDRCRNLLRGFHGEGVPVRELARRLGTRPNTVEVALTRCRKRLYAAFLFGYLDDSVREDDRPAAGRSFHELSGSERRERVARVTPRLGAQMGEVFRAWWFENLSVEKISEKMELAPDETRQLLMRAKREIWRLISEGGAA